ncbi:hypothetical protein M9458_021313, partial [Cirrhinus mrigala]
MPLASTGQTSQDFTTDPAVLPTAEELITAHPEVDEDSSDKSVIEDVVGDLSERSPDVLNSVECECKVVSFQTVPDLSVDIPTTEEPFTGDPEVDEDWRYKSEIHYLVGELSEWSADVLSSFECIYDVDSFETVPEMSVDVATAEEPITGHPEVNLGNIPQASESPTEVDTAAPQSSQLMDNETTFTGINSCSDEIGIELSEGGTGTVHSEICTDEQVAMKFPSKKDIKYIYLEELQDQSLEDEETYGASDVDSKSDSEVPEVPVPADDTPEVSSGWKNWWLRGILTLAMISGFFTSIYLGPMALMMIVLSSQSVTACIAVTLMILATQSQLIIRNLFEGMIWFVVPISCVICNDIMVYVFGFCFGRTPHIKLSPKKTWEGFIGGFISTVVFGLILSYIMAGYPYFVCPVDFNSHSSSFTTNCEPSELFQLQDYTLPSVLQSITGWTTVTLYPFQIHSFALSCFASIMGPFSGFFASGFKRAFRMKDFANTIPGHGGFMDRFDCQFLMATFVNVYIGSVIREPHSCKVLQQILALRPEQQLQIFNLIEAHLRERGL